VAIDGTMGTQGGVGFVRRGAITGNRIATARKTAGKSEPFTTQHFRKWAADLRLDSLKPWIIEPFQQAFLADLFSGVSVAWWVLPEGNAKTTATAGIALYHAEHRAAAGIPVGASSREQAQILYAQAKGFIERSPRLEAIFRCFDGYRIIECKKNGSKIEIKAADPKTADGVIPTLAIVEELHRHKDMSLYRLWRGKIEKQGGQIIAISTAGEPGSEFELTRDSMRQSRDAKITRDGAFTRAISKDFVLHDWAVPENGDVEDLALVKTANPLKAITIARLRRLRNDPAMTLEHWRRFNCDLPTRGSLAAISEAEWEAAATEDRIPERTPIWLGMDVSWSDDTTALMPFLARSKTDRLLGPATIVRAPRDGKLHPDTIKQAILEIHGRNPIAVVVMDQFRAADIAAWIPSATGARVVARSQLDAMAAIDYEKFMEALRNLWLRHAGDAALSEHAMNAIAHMMPSGKHRFERPNRTQVRGRRIQPVDALIAAAMVNGEYAAPQDGGKPTTQRWGAA